MAGASIQVEGLEALKKKFNGIPKDIEVNLDAELHSLAVDYEDRAQAAAPIDRGILKNEITSGKVGELNYEVTSAAPYSPYVEFGTRSRVQVPGELSAYASQFRGAKSSGDAKKQIFDWCKRVGIPKEAWYPIFIKIMTVGVNPHPFFFIHLNWARSEVNKRANAVVKKALG